MAKPQMMVVVKVQDHDKLQRIQIYPAYPDSDEKIMVASYTFQGMMTCGKNIREHFSKGNLLKKEVMLPLDDELFPNGWNNTVLKFINQTTGGSTSGLSDEDHRIEIDHPYKNLFPIIREVLEDLSTDAHWEKQEEAIGMYQSPAYEAYQGYVSPAYEAYQGYVDGMFWKNQFNFLKWTLGIASSLGDIEDQSTERVEHGTRVATSSYDDTREESRSKMKPIVRTVLSSCFPYIASQDHSAEEVDITDHHRSIKGLAKVVMGVSATASCGSSSAIVKAAYAVAFIASLIAFWLPCKWKTTTRVLTKFGAIACAAGVLAAIGYDLPPEYIWVAGLAFIVPAAAVALS